MAPNGFRCTCDARPRLSIIITAHNEGAEAQRTVESVQGNTLGPCEILLVDDGSTDGCCSFADADGIHVIRREGRVGVADSRDLASMQTRGDVLAFFDAHQRIERGSLERCAEVALTRNAIVVPDLCDFDDNQRLHGAYFVQRRDKRFGAEWKCREPRARVTRISSLRAPAYVLPRSLYPKLRWSSHLRGWGGTEAALSLKAFFAGVDILHLCGPLVRHKFKRAFHYNVGWQEVWRNHAITARICFSERTWRRYWWPVVFEPHLTDRDRSDLDSDALLAERDEFARHKVRRDGEYWTRLLFRPIPESLQTRRQPARAP
jgi:glycosyltransferase involved in cell wall biosynthesis